MPSFRHEWKHELNAADHLILRQRLRAVLPPDPHARDGGYRVRSLYFDDGRDTALRQKLDGVDRREKFRLRCYDGDTRRLHLEKKSKYGALGAKSVAELTPEEVRALLAGELDWMPGSGRALVVELYARMRGQGLRPKTLVEYQREPFVFAPGNVRVTLDSDIRTGLGSTDLLDPACPLIPAPGPACLLEVKWDDYLPDLVHDLVGLPGRRAAAFSKYAACRAFDGIV